jgi:hypothetical protein
MSEGKEGGRLMRRAGKRGRWKQRTTIHAVWSWSICLREGAALVTPGDLVSTCDIFSAGTALKNTSATMVSGLPL